MFYRFYVIVVAALVCGCAVTRVAPNDATAPKTIQEVKAELVGQSRAEVKSYFGREPDEVHGQTSFVYLGNFSDPVDESYYTAAVVVFSHFDPDKVWAVGFDSQ